MGTIHHPIMLKVCILVIFSLNSTFIFADTGFNELSINREITFNLTVSPGCIIVGNSDPIDTIDFGAWPQLDFSIEASGAIVLQCTPDVNVNIVLDPGENAATVANRRMSLDGLGVEFVNYQLFTSADLSTAWDDVTGVDLVTDGTEQNIPVYGRIPVQATPSAGTYIDTIQVTITF